MDHGRGSRRDSLWHCESPSIVFRYFTKDGMQSAKYLDVLSQNYDPIKHHDLSKVTQILSTGSPLKPELYDWVYKSIKKDVLLGSITGGTSNHSQL